MYNIIFTTDKIVTLLLLYFKSQYKSVCKISEPLKHALSVQTNPTRIYKHPVYHVK